MLELYKKNMPDKFHMVLNSLESTNISDGQRTPPRPSKRKQKANTMKFKHKDVKENTKNNKKAYTEGDMILPELSNGKQKFFKKFVFFLLLYMF